MLKLDNNVDNVSTTSDVAKKVVEDGGFRISPIGDNLVLTLTTVFTWHTWHQAYICSTLSFKEEPTAL